MFDKNKQKEKMEPIIGKLVSELKNKGVGFKDSDGVLENVVFSYKGKELKIAHQLFYRYSGISCIQKEKDKRTIELVLITDEMFLNSYIKPIIENYFKINND